MSTDSAEKEPEWLEKDLWVDMYEGLIAFEKEHGHLDVPLDYQYHDEYLAIWLDQQRKQERLKSKGRRLSQEKIDLLASIGVDFENGNALPVESAPLKKEPKKEESLDGETEEEEVEDGDADTEDEHWNHMFNGLIELKKTLGHVEPPKGCEFFGVSLYDWAKEQRDRYKDSRKRHTWRTQISRLRNLGFELAPGEKRKSQAAASAGAAVKDLDNDGHWALMFQGLKEYKNMTGNLSVPPGCEYNGYSLYDWVRKQKLRFRNSLAGASKGLLPDRMRRLAALGFEAASGPVDPTAFQPMDGDDFEDYIEALVDFKDAHGHLNLPANYEVDGLNVSAWLDEQRRSLCTKRARESRPAQRRLKRLTELGLPHFSMTLQEARWNMMFEALAEFKAQHGHFRVPSTYLVDSRFLSKWVTKQRSYYQNRIENKKLFLSDERLERLLSIGFEFTPVNRRTNWQESNESVADASDDESETTDALELSPKKQKVSP